MKIMDPTTLKYDETILKENRELMMILYRKVLYSKRKRNTFRKYVRTFQTLEKVTKVKNAQHEAVDKNDIKKYVKNLGKAYEYIIQKILDTEHFQGHADVISLHGFVDPDSYRHNPSNYRTKDVRFGEFYPPEPNKIYSLMDNLLFNMGKIEAPQIKGIYFHHEMVRIHPFVDGNGRTARMVKNWILMYELYPPVFIDTPEDKMNYIDVLERSFKGFFNNPYDANTATEEFVNQELMRINQSIKFLMKEK
jgi:Fic family protein